MSTVFSTDFATLDKPTFDAEWREWTPLWKHACCESRLTDSGLRVESPQEPFGVGGIVRDFPVKEGQAYRFEASASMSDVPNPIQSIQLRVTWMKADQSLHPAGSFVNATVADGSIRFNDTHIAPEGCVRGSLALETKWLRGGTLVWQRVAVSETETPKPRIARIGTLYLRPRNSTPERNLELFCEQIDAAGALNLDILCLPEAMTQIGTSQDVDTLAEAIPGPSTAILGEAA
ncbi:MAG: hypothetical protein O3A46_16540, partial [Candidatus Poribacteria bacterium]|nr:hypothetical protein [Candidatus Poribacteria bacterium]